MKRKTMMLSLVVMTGLVHVVHAKGLGKEGVSSASSTGFSSYTPRYGVKGLLMDPLVPGERPQRHGDNAWQMELSPPPVAYQSQSDDPLTANDKRVGVTFRLDF